MWLTAKAIVGVNVWRSRWERWLKKADADQIASCYPSFFFSLLLLAVLNLRRGLLCCASPNKLRPFFFPRPWQRTELSVSPHPTGTGTKLPTDSLPGFTSKFADHNIVLWIPQPVLLIFMWTVKLIELRWACAIYGAGLYIHCEILSVNMCFSPPSIKSVQFPLFMFSGSSLGY